MWLTKNSIKIKKYNYQSVLKNILSYINNHRYIFMIIMSLLALLLRLNYIDSSGGDYDGFLKIWCKYLKDNGGFKAIASVDTDYNAMYLYFLALFTYIPIKDLYLIKILSFIFDFVMAIVGSYLIEHFKRNSSYKNLYSLTVFSGILLMPTVILNSSRWVQCDSIYTAFLFLTLYFMLKKKYNISFIFYGIAITFKLQAIFLLPAIGIVFLKNRDFSFTKFLWIPLVNFILYIPAIIIGKPITSIFDAYICQTGKYAYKTTLGYPNIYYFFEIDKIELIKPGIIFTMFLLFALMFFVLFSKQKLNDKDIIELSITVLFLVTFFLPEMHDRYGYTAEVLSLVYFFIIRKDWLILLMINLNAFVNYSSFLDGVPEEVLPSIAIYQLVVVLYFTFNFVRNHLKQDCLTE